LKNLPPKLVGAKRVYRKDRAFASLFFQEVKIFSLFRGRFLEILMD